jgi:hypothetical protein
MTKESAPTTPLKLDGIVRVSNTGDREYLRSPEQQEADLRRWAKDNGHELVVIHRAIDQSARKGAHPAIEAAKGRALAGVTDGVVVPYVSRYTRNTLYGLQVLQELMSADKQVFSRDVPFDLRTPEGAKYFRDKLSEAEWESDVRAGAFIRGVVTRLSAASTSACPFGYERSAGRGTPLAINEAEAPAVQTAYRMRAAGHSWQAIADAVNASGILPRPVQAPRTVKQAQWTHKTIRQLVVGREAEVVGNRVYLGVAWNGQREHVGAHPALVEPELFHAANQARGTKPVGPDDGYLLSGLARCQGCGYVMTYNGPDFLRCRAAQHGDGRCPAPVGVNARQLEPLVVADFKRRLRSAVDITGSEASEAVAEAVAQTRRLGMRHANLMAMMPDDLSGARGENWRAQEQTAGAALAAAERDEAEVKAQARGANLPPALTADNFDSWSLPDQRTFIAALFAAVVVRRPNRWREPVAERFGVVLRDQGPANNTALIAHVAAGA